jgi:ribosomal protein S24E
MKDSAIIKELTEIKATAELVVRRTTKILKGLQKSEGKAKVVPEIKEALDKRRLHLLNKNTGSGHYRY